jgi:hypothetical protein
MAAEGLPLPHLDLTHNYWPSKPFLRKKRLWAEGHLNGGIGGFSFRKGLSPPLACPVPPKPRH